MSNVAWSPTMPTIHLVILTAVHRLCPYSQSDAPPLTGTREMRDNFTRALAIVLAETSNQPAGELNAHLAAGLIVSTWNVAFSDAQNLFDRTRDAGEAKRCFLAVIDRGTAGAAAALAKTAYA